MKARLFAALAAMFFFLGCPTAFAQQSQVAQAASCPTGQITCGAWCAKHKPESAFCVSGHETSCSNKKGGTNACVPDKAPATRCVAGFITCGQWCSKYDPNSKTCLTGHSGSCSAMKGGANACVRDKPRS